MFRRDPFEAIMFKFPELHLFLVVILSGGSYACEKSFEVFMAREKLLRFLKGRSGTFVLSLPPVVGYRNAC